jgi:hypothetical protein
MKKVLKAIFYSFLVILVLGGSTSQVFAKGNGGNVGNVGGDTP